MGKSLSEYQIVESLIDRLSTQPIDADENSETHLDQLGVPFGLSSNQVQRLFSNWAGVSPKRFQQFLTARSLQTSLESSQSLLELGMDVGLSSVSRVHAHFINFYAMTPNEYRNHGENLNISHGFYPCPFGFAHIGTTSKGICWLAFVNEGEKRQSVDELKSQWPKASYQEDNLKHRATVTSLFKLEHTAPLYLHIKGTNFQLKVWEALLNIPAGKCASYQTIAMAVNKPSASRAVGSAIGKNPIGWLIPCHRVIRATGVIGHYRWGETRKRSLLGWEAAKSG